MREASPPPQSDPLKEWPAHGGETGALVRAFDWSRTALGPKDGWPQSLKTSVDSLLASQVPMIILWGADGVMIYNDAYSVFAGKKHPEHLGSKVLEGWPEVADFNRHVMTVCRGGETLSFRNTHLVLYRQGVPEDVWMDLDYSAIRDESGEPAGVLAIVVETTERVQAEQRQKQAEEALRALNESLAADRAAVGTANRRLVAETGFLRDLFEQAPSFMAVLRGPEHIFMLANASYSKLIGGREVLGKTIRSALPEVQDQGFFEILDQVYATGVPYTGKQIKVLLQRHASKSLEERFVDFVFQPIQGMDGTVLGVFVEGNDVTKRFLADERLRIAQRAGRIGAFEWFPETGQLHVSDEYRRIWGIASDVEVTDALLLGLVNPDDRFSTGPARLEGPDNPLRYTEYRITRQDTGEIRWLARRGEVVQADERTPRRFVGVVFDITERKKVEAAREESENRFRMMADSAPTLIWACDENATATFINRRYETDFGISSKEGIEERWRQIVHEDDVEAFFSTFMNAFQAREPFIIEVRVRNKQGQLRWLLCEGNPRFEGDGAFVGYVGANVDITQARHAKDALEAEVTERAKALHRTEEALRQAQKMESIGQLTGGIAHDFNNLLQGIIGSLELLQRRVDLGQTDDLGRFLKGATSSANKAAALTHRLLAFSRRQPLDPKPLQVNTLVASMEDLLRRTMGERFEIDLVLSDEVWATTCDHNQLESALLNLAINARDAMPDGGRLTIETCNTTLDRPFPIQQGDVKPGDYVCLSVTDTGTGMAPDVIARAFDPFFTTKPMGQGTGLGLSMIHGFAHQSDGYVHIYSEVGAGTSIKLYLPRYYGELPAIPASPVLSEAHKSLKGEVVLVVEDEPIVRALILEVLTDLGYRALEADDGPSGLAILRSDQRIDLLVTDIGLPGLNGRQIVDEARKQRTTLKVLFMTGYAENATLSNGFLQPGMAMITKPFAVEALATRIRKMIESA